MKKTLYERVRARVPKPVKRVLSPFLRPFVGKYRSELNYWRNRHRTEEGKFENHWYAKTMLAMAGEENPTFLKGKVVADFGCGPRGSLAWVPEATKIGIDVLSTAYSEEFPDDLRCHGMIYVTSTEQLIPMPDGIVDVMYSMNSLDHTADLSAMCSEILRVMKPDAELVASFNLHEPPTAAEPQVLTEESLDEVLLRHFEAQSIRFGRHVEGDTYREIQTGKSTYVKGKQGYMWFRGRRIPQKRPSKSNSH
jgi:ubiquinone/menaquinone biosynthesis C-methylase UbiE